jgi:pimeloyl-ACP methyl ester carboxylesterase
MEAQGRPWQWPAKQEPTEAPPERRGRNSRLHGGKEVNGVLLLLADGTQLSVTELPGAGPWTFLVLQPDPAPGAAARSLTRFGRAVVPDLRGRPGRGAPPGEPGFLDLVDDLDQVRTRAGLGRPVLVGLGELAPVALRAAADQPWAWRALVLVPPAAHPPAAELGQPDLPALVLDAEPTGAAEVAAVERLLERLGEGPGWAGIAPDAPPR